MFEKLFHLKENNTNVKTEILAGVTTFLAMAYILAVNPNILSASGMDRGGVLIATALASFVGTILMAFMANYPFVLAPGMGLNAYFTYTVCLTMGYSWQFALAAVYVEGALFLLLSLLNVREAIFNAIPLALKSAVGVGIGLFIAFIALQNAHIIVDSPATLITIQGFNINTIHTHGICAILAMLGTIITAALMQRNIRGSILIGILATWFLGMIAQATKLYQVDPEMGCFSLYPNFSFSTFAETFRGFKSICGALFRASSWTQKSSSLTGYSLLGSMNFFTVMFAFLFVDLFDTLGTLIGVATKANMLDEKGRLPRIKGALLSDSIATSVGAIFGTSTTTTFVESATGVAEGGRTGLTALTAAILFLLAILFSPLFLAIPAFATAPALIVVGFYMMTTIVRIDFNNLYDAIPAYITIIAMPFAYSISEGISFGVISWTILNLCSRNWRKVSWLMYVLTVLFILKYALL
ncbi:MAG: NCS2 family permease [Lentisphaeria bacterium]|nr:NCS2 family permease [Lentisphaeria bacterium]